MNTRSRVRLSALFLPAVALLAGVLLIGQAACSSSTPRGGSPTGGTTGTTGTTGTAGTTGTGGSTDSGTGGRYTVTPAGGTSSPGYRATPGNTTPDRDRTPSATQPASR